MSAAIAQQMMAQAVIVVKTSTRPIETIVRGTREKRRNGAGKGGTEAADGVTKERVDRCSGELVLIGC